MKDDNRPTIASIKEEIMALANVVKRQAVYLTEGTMETEITEHDVDDILTQFLLIRNDMQTLKTRQGMLYRSVSGYEPCNYCKEVGIPGYKLTDWGLESKFKDWSKLL